MFLLNDLEFYYDKLVEYIDKQLKTSIAQTSTLYGLCQEVVLLKVAKCDLDVSIFIICKPNFIISNKLNISNQNIIHIMSLY